MNLLSTALLVLNKITVDGDGFSQAISYYLRSSKNDVAHRKDISALVGCALRHYFVLSHRYNEIEGHNDEAKNAYILAASNIVLTKKVSRKDTYVFLKENVKDSVLLENIDSSIKSFEDGNSFIPSSLDQASLEYLSFKYNTPLWLVKMWRKHYGYKAMRKILVANTKHFVNFARINNEFTSKEDFLRDNPTFVPSNFEDFYLLNEKSNMKKTKAFLDQHILVYPVALKEVIELADTDTFRGIAAYAATPNNLLSALTAELTSYLEMDFMIGKQQAWFEVKAEKERYNLKNVHLYEGNSTGLVTCISKKVHTMFILPDSSNFFLLRNTPDYAIRFDQNSLDELLNKQAEALENGAEFVEEGGYLAYVIQTISEKESHGVVSKFLENHPEFTLVKDKQIMPYSEYETSMYYAVMRKEIKND